MTIPQQNIAQALVRVQDFSTARAADFTHNPLTKVDAKHADTLAKLSEAITRLGGKAAIQAGGGFGQSTGDQKAIRQELEDELRGINRTASSIAEEKKTPAMMDRFRMPSGSGDQELEIKARGMAAAIRELGLNDEFLSHGHEEETNENGVTDVGAVLENTASDLEDSEGAQGTAISTQSGATAVIPDVIRDGKSAMKTLDAIYNNVYKTNAEMLGAWKTASHVERRSPRAKKPAPTPAP